MSRYPLLLGFYIICISGCNLDPNEPYTPATRYAFFLLEEGPGQRNILMAEKETFLPNWEATAGLGPGELSDFSLYETQLWLASATRKQIFAWDLSASKVSASYDIPDVSPHFLCAGERYLLLGDTLQKRLGFLDKKSGSLVYFIELPYVPRTAVYLSAKFFVAQSDSSVGIYQEQALAPLAHLKLPAPFLEFQLDNSNFVYAYSQDSSLLSTKIDYNANSEDGTVRLTFEQVRLSPYLRQQVGTEWLQDLYTLNQQLFSGRDSRPLAEEVSQFEVDFYSGKVYYQQKDTLYVVQLSNRNPYSHYPLTQKILKTGYYREFIGE